MAWSVPSHYLNQWWLHHSHIYASLGLNQLNYFVTWRGLSPGAFFIEQQLRKLLICRSRTGSCLQCKCHCYVVSWDPEGSSFVHVRSYACQTWCRLDLPQVVIIPHHNALPNNLVMNWKYARFNSTIQPFSKQHFQMHFLEWKCISFD